MPWSHLTSVSPCHVPCPDPCSGFRSHCHAPVPALCPRTCPISISPCHVPVPAPRPHVASQLHVAMPRPVPHPHAISEHNTTHIPVPTSHPPAISLFQLLHVPMSQSSSTSPCRAPVPAHISWFHILMPYLSSTLPMFLSPASCPHAMFLPQLHIPVSHPSSVSSCHVPAQHPHAMFQLHVPVPHPSSTTLCTPSPHPHTPSPCSHVPPHLHAPKSHPSITSPHHVPAPFSHPSPHPNPTSPRRYPRRTGTRTAALRGSPLSAGPTGDPRGGGKRCRARDHRSARVAASRVGAPGRGLSVRPHPPRRASPPRVPASPRARGCQALAERCRLLAPRPPPSAAAPGAAVAAGPLRLRPPKVAERGGGDAGRRRPWWGSGGGRRAPGVPRTREGHRAPGVTRRENVVAAISCAGDGERGGGDTVRRGGPRWGLSWSGNIVQWGYGVLGAPGDGPGFACSAMDGGPKGGAEWGGGWRWVLS